MAGALYLLYLGIAMLRAPAHAAPAKPAAAPESPGAARALAIGLLTSLTNPKSGVFWTSVFVVAFPAGAPTWMYPATLLMIMGLSLAWHLLLVTLFSRRPVRRLYLRLKRPVDRAIGAILIAFGVGLIVKQR